MGYSQILPEAHGRAGGRQQVSFAFSVTHHDARSQRTRFFIRASGSFLGMHSLLRSLCLGRKSYWGTFWVRQPTNMARDAFSLWKLSRHVFAYFMFPPVMFPLIAVSRLGSHRVGSIRSLS